MPKVKTKTLFLKEAGTKLRCDFSTETMDIRI